MRHVESIETVIFKKLLKVGIDLGEIVSVYVGITFIHHKLRNERLPCSLVATEARPFRAVRSGHLRDEAVRIRVGIGIDGRRAAVSV